MTRHIDPEVLMAHLLGESAAETAATIEQHLAECATCHRQVSGMRQVMATFAGATAPRPRAAVLDSLLAAQARRGSPRRRRALQNGLWAAGTVAAVLGIFAVGFWTGRRTSPGPLDSRPLPVVKEAVDRAREPDLAAPDVTFVAAIPDRVAGLAKRDTTTN